MRFGSEYSLSRRWSVLQRLYIKLFGIVDLPTRIRAREILATVNADVVKLIDFGTGTGVYSYYFSRKAERIVQAVDVDAPRLADVELIAKKLNRDNLKVTQADERFFEDAKTDDVDIILAVEVLQYCHDLRNVLLHTKRVLRPGGALIAHVPLRTALLPFEQRLFTRLSFQELALAEGFELAKAEATFSPSEQRLCQVFEWASRHPILLPVVFPVLLLVSFLLRTRTENGASMLFVCRKPNN